MRQRKWRRWGIALSVAWFLGAGYWALDTELHKGDAAVAQFDLCMANSGHPADAGGCIVQFDKDYVRAIQYRWERALIVGLVPIPFAWLLAYGVLARTRRRSGLKAA